MTGKKRWVSESVKGTGRAARNKAKETEGRLLGQVAAGKHRYTLHGLRHFMGTQVGAVAGAATVRARMGHGSLAVSSIYVHPVSKADQAAAKHMGKVLDGKPARGRRPKGERAS